MVATTGAVPTAPPVLVGVAGAVGRRTVTARHAELLRDPSLRAGRTWSAVALHACLDHLRTSTVTSAARVAVVDAWLDGPDALCVLYRPPFDEGRVVGLRRSRGEALEAREWRLGDLTSWGYSLEPGRPFRDATDGGDGGDPDDPAAVRDAAVDPVAFGWNVADFDLGEPLGFVVTILRYDRADVGWWGRLEAELPEPPR